MDLLFGLGGCAHQMVEGRPGGVELVGRRIYRSYQAMREPRSFMANFTFAERLLGFCILLSAHNLDSHEWFATFDPCIMTRVGIRGLGVFRSRGIAGMANPRVPSRDCM